MTETVFTVMCLVCDGSKILIKYHIDGLRTGALLPGGQVRRDESFTDAVKRCVLRDTGLSVDNLVLCGIKHWNENSDRKKVTLLYKTDTFSGDLVRAGEDDVYRIERSELEKIKAAPGMENTFRLLLEGGFSEQFFQKEDGEWKEILK